MEQRAPLLDDDTVWLYPTTDTPDTALGWIGGRPDLPHGMAAPKAARFLAQIDMSALPAALWRGRGPRRGWLRLFLAENGQPIVIHSTQKGTPTNGTDTLRRDLARTPYPAAPPEPLAFDLSHPSCQPVNLASALELMAALHAELDRSVAYLDKLSAEASAEDASAQAEQKPGANGIWGRMLRSAPQPRRMARPIANPGILHTGHQDIAAARATLARIDDLLDRVQDELPPEGLALICDVLGHLELPLFLSEPAPDLPTVAEEPEPVRIYQRNVPAVRSAWGPEGTPRSRWAEDWHLMLAARACAMLATDKEALPPEARADWEAYLASTAEATTLAMGDVTFTAEGPVASLLRLPRAPLIGWNWQAEALEICLPLAALAEGDFSQSTARWTEDQLQ
ncbi:MULTISPECIES: DUF1963 domain-containing protein [unclassified Marinovum]